MTELTVGWPLALWGLAAIPLIVLLALHSRFPIGWRRRAMVIATRVLAIALLVAAMADVRMGWPTRELAVATVIDASPSVAEADRERVRQQLAELTGRSPDTAWVSPPSASDVAPATDVSVGVAMLPRDRVRRMVVATDGRDRGGDLGASIAAAQRAGVDVSIVPMGDDPPIDGVSVRGLSVPRMVRAGDRLDVGVELHASRDADVELAMALDGQPVASGRALARRGDSTSHLSVRFPEEEGVYALEVRARADSDPIAANDRWVSLVRVSPKPRVRILHDPQNGRPALAQVLEEGGMEVEVTAMIAAPTRAEELEPYALVIVDEADLNDLTETQQRALRTWVEDEGGGLVTVTGSHPMRRTPRVLREIEPITIPPAIPEPRPLELILVIDRSSSMSGIKIQQARSAAVAAVRSLRADARVGVVAFSGAADRVMAPVGMDQAGDVISFIQGIHASGGTNIAAALRAANAITSGDPRYIRHVILLSDGVSEPSEALSAAQAIAGRGISISTITLGPRNDLMEGIARIGRGRYHVTDSAGSLPNLFVREAQYRQPPAHRRRRVVPRVVNRVAMLDGVPFDTMPALGGHVTSTARRGATTVLATPDRLPILAHWHRGLGQVATFASATTGAWADAWRQWEGFRELWVSLAEGMLRTRTVNPPELRLNAHPLVEGVQVLTVLAPTIESEPVPVVQLHRPGAPVQPLPLVQRGPGVWQADLVEDQGFLVDARMPIDERPTVAVGFDRPYDPELSLFGSNRAELERLAAAGGGRVLDRVDAIVEEVEERSVMRSVRTPLLAGALALYLLGLLLLRLPDHSVSATVVRPERSKRRWSGRTSGAPPAPRVKEAA
jgi:Ca-activated chloride channel family protein